MSKKLEVRWQGDGDGRLRSSDHVFAADADLAATDRAWSNWLNDVFTKETVA